MTRILLASALLVALGVTVTARAADASGSHDWTGYYVGANAGGAWSELSNTLTIQNGNPNSYFFGPAIPGVAASGSQDYGPTGIAGGGQIGFNWQFHSLGNLRGNPVLGIEVDYSGLDLEEREGGRFLYTTNNAPYFLTEQASTDWLATVRPRLGWAMNHALVYATGGVAVTRLEFEQSFTEPPFTPTPGSTSYSESEVGWTAGGGFEYAFNEHWSLKTEYLYNHFNGETALGVLANANGASALPGLVDTATFVNAVSDFDIHTVRAGLNFKF